MRATFPTLAAITLLFACGKDKPTSTTAAVPDAVTKAFQREHSAVKQVSWEQEGDLYEAEFVVDGVGREVIYDAQGNLKATVYEGASLPLPAVSALAALLPNGEVREVEAIVTAEDTTFEVEVAAGGQIHEIVIDASGTIISQEIEEEEAGGEEDDAAEE